ncbi:MAG: fibronectin type III domain-containing protein [Gemmatimonadota bacterium]|nr:fibronectin type III domain-containing protein [Gemmatimonadota bacterium]
MALSPTQRWKDIAAAGTASPVLQFEIKPTVLSDERNCAGDWQGGASLNGLDTAHPTDELRLEVQEVEHPRSQCDQTGGRDRISLAWASQSWTGTRSGWTQYYRASLVQTFRVEQAFRLEKLYLGIAHEYAASQNRFPGRIEVKVLRGLRPVGTTEGGVRESLSTVLEQAQQVAEHMIDFKQEYLTESDADGAWYVIDFSEANIWIPGGEELCAIMLAPDTDQRLDSVRVYCNSSGSYQHGQCYAFKQDQDKYARLDFQPAFKFKTCGYRQSGSGAWTFDMGQQPDAHLAGEVEFTCNEPNGTGISFWYAEGATLGQLSGARAWIPIQDGGTVTKRFVRIKAFLTSDEHRIETPRVYSMRVSFRRSEKFLLASRPLFGYPNCVAEAPDYSAEGEPLSGEASTTDTSRIVMLDPGGMVSNLFSLYTLKNDEIVIRLGFDTEDFLDTSAADYNEGNGDWLPFKTVWIEDWEPGEGTVTVHGYDQQVRFKRAVAPTAVEPPEMTEQIHYNHQGPEAIKKDLLRRARIRPSRIDESSFSSLGAAFDWQLNYEISRQSGLREIDNELNSHLLAFQIVDEQGRWKVAWADFSAAPGQENTLGPEDILAGSERFYPGLKHLRNYCTVFFGGTGRDETQYTDLVVGVSDSRQSEKAYREFAVDKLLSQFIPATDDPGDSAAGIARKVARQRRALQEHGLRMIEFSTPLKFACLQIGDHVNLSSALYRRAGTSEPNPLLAMITRKNIDRGLGSINWSAAILLDNEQCPLTESALQPPSNLSVSPGGDAAVSWSWSASPDDDGSAGRKYLLYQRLSHLSGWKQVKAEVQTDGSAGYNYPDSDFKEAVAYDFGLRFVNASGRKSAIVTCENVELTVPVPGTPAVDDWTLWPVAGGVELNIENELSEAVSYNVYVRDTAFDRWALKGSIAAGTPPGGAFIYRVEDPYEPGWHLFTIEAVNSWGRPGEKAAQKMMCHSVQASPVRVLNAPSLASSGGYPLVSRVAVGPHHAFSITHRISAFTGEENLVDRYELQRRDDSGNGAGNWSQWQKLPEYRVRQPDSTLPAPETIYYDNTDRKFKPGWYYQYRCRAVSKAGNPGLWSDTVQVQLTEDATAPDQPTVTVTALTGANHILVSEPAQNGGPCPDFSHFKIEAKKSGGSWQTLDSQLRSRVYLHLVAVTDLETDWQYRVTAYDHSGNASPVSAESSASAPARAVSSYLADSSVGNAKLASGSVTGGKVASGTLTASNISSSAGLSGGQLHITSGVTFDNDCEIQGLLKASGGIKTSTSDDERIEIGKFNGNPVIKIYGGGEVGVQLKAFPVGNGSFGWIMVNDPGDFFALGGDYQTDIFAYWLQLGEDVPLVLGEAGAGRAWQTVSDRGNMGWIHADKQLNVYDGSDYVFTPDQNGSHINDASTASGNPADLNAAVTKTDFDALVGKFNDVLDLLDAANVMAAS